MAINDRDENYDRALWQSARTKNGKVAPPPLLYNEAWDAAYAEKEAREQAQQKEESHESN